MAEPVCFESSTGATIPTPLCAKCYAEAFCPEAWTKLQGLHASLPARLGEASDRVFDGEAAYTVVYTESNRLPLQRDPILRLRRTAEGWLEGEGVCWLCRIVCEMRGRGGMLGDGEVVVVDLQLFYAGVCSGAGSVRLPWLLSVRVEVGRVGAKRSGKIWQRRRLVAMMFENDEKFDFSAGLATPVDEEVGLLPGSKTNHDESDVDALGFLDDARLWIRECEAGHVECTTLTTALLPTRVLRVQAHEGAYTVKLIDFAQERGLGSYIALSYVWGTKPTLSLLKGNHQAFLGDIGYGGLPKTMQDAVRATSALNISYLWIDALCIVQDDNADKEIEIPYMNEYYRNASAVISASGASDAHAGFLTKKPSAKEIYTRAREQALYTHEECGAIPYRIPFRTSAGVMMCILDTQPALYNHDAEPINERGWTLQESTLARRLLTFPSTGGVIARCNKGVQCFGEILGDPFHEVAGSAFRDDRSADVDDVEESDEESEESDGESNEGESDAQVPDLDISDDEESSELFKQIGQASWEYELEANRTVGIRLAERTEEGKAKEGEAAVIRTVVDEWSAVVQDYTRRSLTQPGDILIALGGLAKDYHAQNERIVGTYLAGLWSGTLLKGLLWHTSTHGHLDGNGSGMSSSGLGNQSHAPSWSWASCGQPVTFRIDKEPDLVMRGKPEEPQWCVEVLDCSTIAKSQRNPFGAVIEGSLNIRGMLLPIERHPGKRKGAYHRSLQDGTVVAIRLAGSGNDAVDECELFSADSASAAALLLNDRCFWLPMYDATRRRTRGLIVREEADGDFRRLGFAEFGFAGTENIDTRAICIV